MLNGSDRGPGRLMKFEIRWENTNKRDGLSAARNICLGHPTLALPHTPGDTMQRYNNNAPPPPHPLPAPSQSTPAMSVPTRASEDSLFSDKEFLDPLPSTHSKSFGRRKPVLFATATLVSLLFLASYLTIQHRASDGFGGEVEPFPFDPEGVERSSNVSYPLGSGYSSLRGPPTPLFKGV
jgi:hypothetical protein